MFFYTLGFLYAVPCAYNALLPLFYLENSSSFMTHINCHVPLKSSLVS